MVTASTENILSLTDKVMGSPFCFWCVWFFLSGVLGVAAAHLLLRPFKKLQMSFDRVAQGDLDADITEETYRETRLLSQSVQKSLSKLKAVDQSRQEFVSNVSHELKTPSPLSVCWLIPDGDGRRAGGAVPGVMTDISDEIDGRTRS